MLLTAEFTSQLACLIIIWRVNFTPITCRATVWILRGEYHPLKLKGWLSPFKCEGWNSPFKYEGWLQMCVCGGKFNHKACRMNFTLGNWKAFVLLQTEGVKFALQNTLRIVCTYLKGENSPIKCCHVSRPESILSWEWNGIQAQSWNQNDLVVCSQFTTCYYQSLRTVRILGDYWCCAN